MSKTWTKEQVVKAAIDAGFSGHEEGGLSGITAFDEKIYYKEYPVGERILAFVKALGVEVKE